MIESFLVRNSLDGKIGAVNRGLLFAKLETIDVLSHFGL